MEESLVSEEFDNGPPEDDNPPQDDGSLQNNGPPKKPRRRRNNNWNQNYNNAYGDYRGGYGPGGGYGPIPPLGFGPVPPFGFAPGPPDSPYSWGKGFGPAGPPNRRFNMEDRVLKYLTRCGVSNDLLRNMPREILQMIEPQFCGLCSINFDSFTMSRMHYVSKNHSKNQRKWLTQQKGFNMGGGAREIPLKSRDLYCELCDVHITSKTHADSHYAGKPHRAIVDGRKLPKNPALLQRGMEDRVDQLIRREKKNLKPIEVYEEEKEEKTKSCPPELYCDICKTSVTCTEQMTMHLNGKRHLAKEKQHILKMMKPETYGAQNNSALDFTTNDDVTMTEDNGQAAGAVQEGGGDDWGNGSGTWEDTALY